MKQWFYPIWKKVNDLSPMPWKPAVSPEKPPPPANELEGKRLRYMIGTNMPGIGASDLVTEVSYDYVRPVPFGISIKYGNLFNEKFSEQSEEVQDTYGPYLHSSDTAEEYGEGQIDPAGPGWKKNIDEQCARAVAAGFHYIELDNPDAYSLGHVLVAVDRAAGHGLKVIAKNPLLIDGDPSPYLAHPAVMGAIVERGAGNPADMNNLRKKAGKPTLPVWFVAFDKGWQWINAVAKQCMSYKEMSCTYSNDGEYTSSKDITWR